MSVYKSGGLPYIGVNIYSRFVDSSWYRLSEIYEFTELPWEWDQIDFTSHDAAITAHGHTRTAKPGLLVQSTLTFKGIWMAVDLYTFEIHGYIEDAFRTREIREWEIEYSFARTSTDRILRYRGMAYVVLYSIGGDLGDKFVYTVRLLFEGDPQPYVTAKSDVNEKIIINDTPAIKEKKEGQEI